MFSSNVQTKVIPSNTNTVLLSQSHTRYGIVFINSGDPLLYIHNKPMTARQQGLVLGTASSTGTFPWEMNCVQHGSCVQDTWYVWSDAGVGLMAFIEIMACSCEELQLLTDALGDGPHSAYSRGLGSAMAAQVGPLTSNRAKGY